MHSRAALALPLALAAALAGTGLARADTVPVPNFRPAEGTAVAARGDTPRECLAMALYHEARGEPVEGQLAVGRGDPQPGRFRLPPRHGVRRRLQERAQEERLPVLLRLRRACRQPAQRPRRGERKLELAEELMACDATCREAKREEGGVESSTHYHATYVSPSWASKLERTGKVGNHVFYFTSTI